MGQNNNRKPKRLKNMSEQTKKKGTGMSLMAHLDPSKIKEVVIEDGGSYENLLKSLPEASNFIHDKASFFLNNGGKIDFKNTFWVPCPDIHLLERKCVLKNKLTNRIYWVYKIEDGIAECFCTVQGIHGDYPNISNPDDYFVLKTMK
jgi:hypothetical protein